MNPLHCPYCGSVFYGRNCPSCNCPSESAEAVPTRSDPPEQPASGGDSGVALVVAPESIDDAPPEAEPESAELPVTCPDCGLAFSRLRQEGCPRCGCPLEFAVEPPETSGSAGSAEPAESAPSPAPAVAVPAPEQSDAASSPLKCPDCGMAFAGDACPRCGCPAQYATADAPPEPKSVPEPEPYRPMPPVLTRSAPAWQPAPSGSGSTVALLAGIVGVMALILAAAVLGSPVMRERLLGVTPAPPPAAAPTSTSASSSSPTSAAEQDRLGTKYFNGDGIPKDYAQAVFWYRKAAEQGYAIAQNNLGECYRDGDGVSRDYAQAVSWFRKSADHGYARAQRNLGVCYYNGNGVSQDYAQAVSWYRKAAEQGYADAQNLLGVCCHDGKGVSQDYAQALSWYRKAAEQGNASAQGNLGYCYYNGQGVSKDYAQAVDWLRKAAEQGHARSQYYLGDCYHYGRGVPRSSAQALEWYRKAEAQGNGDAKKRLKEISQLR